MLQPDFEVFMKMYSDTTATTPGWNGSAEIAGSVPLATKNSRTLGAGRGVDVGAGVAGSTPGVAMDAVADAGAADGVTPDGPEVAAAAVVLALTTVTATSASEPITRPATTRPAIARTRIRRCGFASVPSVVIVPQSNREE
jgi:hypothetical protein